MDNLVDVWVSDVKEIRNGGCLYGLLCAYDNLIDSAEGDCVNCPCNMVLGKDEYDFIQGCATDVLEVWLK